MSNGAPMAGIPELWSADEYWRRRERNRSFREHYLQPPKSGTASVRSKSTWEQQIEQAMKGIPARLERPRR